MVPPFRAPRFAVWWCNALVRARRELLVIIALHVAV